MSQLNLSKNQLKELKTSVVAALKPQQGSMMAKRSKTPGRSRGGRDQTHVHGLGPEVAPVVEHVLLFRIMESEVPMQLINL